VQRNKIDSDNNHETRINSLTEIKVKRKGFNLQGFITTGEDKKVMVWNRNGELWGSIDLLREKVLMAEWTFPFNWKHYKREQLNQVKRVIAQLDHQKTTGDLPPIN
jgi:hypothetical protein